MLPAALLGLLVAASDSRHVRPHGRLTNDIEWQHAVTGLQQLRQHRQRPGPVSGSAAANTVCESGTYPPPPERAVPHYIINLDLPPEYRYCKVMEDLGPAASHLLSIVRSEVAPIIGENTFKAVEKLSEIIGRKLPYPFPDEIRGIATAASMEEGDVALMNIFYEVFTVCTSIIGRAADGTLYHGRNLDFGLFMGWDMQNHTWKVAEALRPLTVTFEYQRDNRTLFRTAGFAGMVGVLTGVRPGLFSLSIDERFTLKPGLWYMLEWAFGGANVQWNTVITRQVLENGTDYTAVQKQLAKTPLMAPVYFILGGNGSSEACVITRDQYKADIWPLGTPSVSQKSTWYLLQTNYDHWKRPPFFDNRRDPGVRCMDRLGADKLTPETLYDVLNSKPVRNRLSVYTALMQANQGHMEAWLQYCTDPDCAIW
ncbi:acid ceramidase-like [Amphibalanus amphitrite]|uniref:acid ceramidase-like n=1 Tax=Amphibalanus amphitrite TaxID=1232801 RepID=UPI001C90F3A8|nr:acid ceramidase-like [Amphibalanus amphitrite]